MNRLSSFPCTQWQKAYTLSLGLYIEATTGSPLSCLFATCREHTQEQFSKYVNRYGPGMVIYWFGFIDDLQDADSDLVLVDSFPSSEDTIQLPCLPIPKDILGDYS